MQNPWLKKNPLMSMWLSAANSMANTMRAHATVQIIRQTTAAVTKVINETLKATRDVKTSERGKTKRRR